MPPRRRRRSPASISPCMAPRPRCLTSRPCSGTSGWLRGRGSRSRRFQARSRTRRSVRRPPRSPESCESGRSIRSACGGMPGRSGCSCPCSRMPMPKWLRQPRRRSVRSARRRRALNWPGRWRRASRVRSGIPWPRPASSAPSGCMPPARWPRRWPSTMPCGWPTCRSSGGPRRFAERSSCGAAMGFRCSWRRCGRRCSELRTWACSRRGSWAAATGPTRPSRRRSIGRSSTRWRPARQSGRRPTGPCS